MRRQECIAAVGLCVAALGVQTVHAQSADTSDALAEVVVTARKTAERLQDVPVAISAFTAEEIASAGLTDLNDLARFSPGINFQNQFGRRDTPFNTSIRGVSSVSNAALDFKPFANFVDGVYVRGSLESFDLSDVERVEILRGPQAALYGRATESGAINYITRQPSNDFEGEASASFGGFDYQRETLRFSGPIVKDLLYFNLNGSYYSRDGEYFNEFDGKSDDSQRTKAFSGSLKFTPITDLEATLRVGYSRDEDGPPAFGYLNGNENNCFLNVYPYYCGVVPTKTTVDLNTALPIYYGFRSSTTRGSLNIEYHLGDFLLSSITGWDTNHQKIGEDQSYDAYLFPPGEGLPPDGFIDSFNEDSHSVSQEFRLTSPRNQPFRYLAGIYDYYETVATQDVQASFDLITYGALDRYTSTVKDVAGFAQAEYDFVQNWTVSAEARWQQDRISYNQPVIPGGYDKESTYTAVNPRVVLSFHATPDVLFYASTGRGTKPGGFNNPYTPQDTFAEEKLWAYELGTKTEWLDRRLSVNADIYYNHITDLQVTQTVALASGAITSYDTNAGRAHTEGFELEAAAKVTSMFGLHATYSYNIAKFDDFQGFQDLCNLAGQYTPDFIFFQGPITNPACLSSPTGNARGKTLPNAPKNIASLQADITVPISEVRGFFRPQVSYKSSSYDEAENLAETGSQTQVDWRLGVEGNRWSVAGWARNMNDNRHANYLLRYIDYGSFNTEFFGPNRSFGYALPDRRQFGVEGRYKF
jgi:outer membrane receptor protein involved in Fe transport